MIAFLFERRIDLRLLRSVQYSPSSDVGGLPRILINSLKEHLKIIVPGIPQFDSHSLKRGRNESAPSVESSTAEQTMLIFGNQITNEQSAFGPALAIYYTKIPCQWI